jgi:OmcA/MtrC family decaheme c-type cytochrome
VDINQCLLCHERLGFHSNEGRANNPDHCVMCHNPENTSSNVYAGYVKPATTGTTIPKPWSIAAATDPGAFFVSQQPMNLKDMVHRLHAGSERFNPFNFMRGNPNSTSGGSNAYQFGEVGFPANLADCKACHGTKKIGTGSTPTFAAAIPANVLWTVVDAQPGLGATASSPEKMTRIAPTAAACGDCHDSSSSEAHFEQNAAFGGAESCSVCHGPGRTADVEVAHSMRFQ